MRTTVRIAFRVLVALLATTALAPRSRSEILNSTSSPTGATVEIDGVVVGINTLKVLSTQGAGGGVSLQGIGFALSASDLIQLLQRFYPKSTVSAMAAQSEGVGNLRITSDPTSAEIYIDGKYVEQTPSTIPTPTSSHKILLGSSAERTGSEN
jgi:hypothetical protein